MVDVLAASAASSLSFALAASFPGSASTPTIYLGNDGGLWQSTDGVAESGSPCATTDATHFQNLNSAIGAGGSLAEVVGFAQDSVQTGTLMAGLGSSGTAASSIAGSTSAWAQLSAGEGGFPLIDSVNSANWYASIGAGVNVKRCTSGAGCTAANFSGSSDIGAVQTGYDAALVDAPALLDPQMTSQLLTATCRVQ